MADPPRPLLVWMIYLDRDFRQEDYDKILPVIKQDVPLEVFHYGPPCQESLLGYAIQLLPLIMMAYRKVPLNRWHRRTTDLDWQDYIIQDPDPKAPGSGRTTTLGYRLDRNTSLGGMVVTQGEFPIVVNVGLGIERYWPLEEEFVEWYKKQGEKLTRYERRYLDSRPEEVRLRDLGTILSMKTAYFKAAFPVADDGDRQYLSLEVDLVQNVVRWAGLPWLGWGFRCFSVEIEVVRQGALVQEKYECTCAYALANPQEESKILRCQVATPKDATGDHWVQFVTVAQAVKSLDKIGHATLEKKESTSNSSVLFSD